MLLSTGSKTSHGMAKVLHVGYADPNVNSRDVCSVYHAGATGYRGRPGQLLAVSCLAPSQGATMNDANIQVAVNLWLTHKARAFHKYVSPPQWRLCRIARMRPC